MCSSYSLIRQMNIVNVTYTFSEIYLTCLIMIMIMKMSYWMRYTEFAIHVLRNPLQSHSFVNILRQSRKGLTTSLYTNVFPFNITQNSIVFCDMHFQCQILKLQAEKFALLSELVILPTPCFLLICLLLLLFYFILFFGQEYNDFFSGERKGHSNCKRNVVF